MKRAKRETEALQFKPVRIETYLSLFAQSRVLRLKCLDMIASHFTEQEIVTKKLVGLFTKERLSGRLNLF